MDLNVFLTLLFTQYLRDSCPLLGVLKTFNQTFIAPAFLLLKTKFGNSKVPFVDKSGTWKISISIGTIDEKEKTEGVVVTHSKEAKSIETNPEGYFRSLSFSVSLFF